MNCARVDELLLDYVEDALDAAERRAVDAHLEGCAQCRRRLAETRALLGDLAEARSASVAGSSQPSIPQVVRVTSWSAGTRLGDFEIIEELGRGGMGTVYRARQLSLNRVVALKVLPAAMAQTPGLVKRFITEAHAAAKLHHTNIVAVYAQGQHDGHLFYAMELIEGEGLERALRRAESGLAARQPARDYRRLARLVSEAADALEHAHAQSVIHRDIKPQNILLGRDGRLHVTDFGLARLFDEPGVTQSGEMLGTPAYMSPEQVGADRRKIDHRTDIFSLGVTFYELLTGARPFDGITRDQIVARICTTDPIAPRKLDATIPIDLETICLRALEKDAARRYQTAGEMAADLRRFAENLPIRARRVGPIEKARKWVKRHPGATTVMALCGVLAIGATLWAVQYRRSRHETANRLVAQAWELLAYGDYREPAQAEQLLTRARPLQPDEVPFLKARALALIRDNKEESLRLLQRAVQLSPNDQELLYLYAWALFRNDQFVEHRDVIKRADVLGEQRTPAANFFRGQAKLRQYPDEAVNDYREAIADRKYYAQAMVHLGRANSQWMYHVRKLDRWDETRRHLATACDLLPNKAYPRYLSSLAYRIAAEINQADGKPEAAELFEQARRYALEAQTTQPANPRGYVAESEYWESRGDFSKALEARDRSFPHLENRNDQTEFYEYRWRLYYWMGRYDDALADLRMLTEITPASAPRRPWFSHYFQALLLAEQGKRHEAVRLAKELPAAHPANPIVVVGGAGALWTLGETEEAAGLLDASRRQLRFDSVELPNVPPELHAAAFEFACGRRSWQEIQRIAGDQPDPSWLTALVALIDGCRQLGMGDRAAALDRFRQADRSFDDEGFCYLSRVFVRRMEADPEWPAWIPARK